MLSFFVFKFSLAKSYSISRYQFPYDSSRSKSNLSNISTLLLEANKHKLLRTHTHYRSGKHRSKSRQMLPLIRSKSYSLVASLVTESVLPLLSRNKFLSPFITQTAISGLKSCQCIRLSRLSTPGMRHTHTVEDAYLKTMYCTYVSPLPSLPTSSSEFASGKTPQEMEKLVRLPPVLPNLINSEIISKKM